VTISPTLREYRGKGRPFSKAKVRSR